MRRGAPTLVVVLLVTLAGCGGDSDEASTGAATTAERTAASNSDDSAESAATGFPKARACRKPAEPTPEQTEGPYYKPGPPKRRSLIEAGVSGRRLLVQGRILATDCRPLNGARVDFWQADGEGAYDNDGYRLRGYQLTDSKGRYRVATVVPGQYEGRTPHIHVKVKPPGGDILTTQLYLPGEVRNRTDSIFVPEAVVRLRRGSAPWRGTFDFVVER